MRFHTVTIGPCTLILGDCLEVLRGLDPVDHIIGDPPYEEIMHKAKAKAAGRGIRTDGGAEPKPLNFAGIDDIREEYVAAAQAICQGWHIAFCSPEGVGRWADAINASDMKYKRACYWVKPDAMPQMNGQGPAMGGESFTCAFCGPDQEEEADYFTCSWCGNGHARWNAGGKRGVYTHMTNPPDRHGGHPTEKPWRLMREIIMDFTKPGDLICDPFMGSGTTLVAAVRAGRRAIGIERNPDYFEMACQRVRMAVRGVDALGAQTVLPKQVVLI